MRPASIRRYAESVFGAGSDFLQGARPARLAPAMSDTVRFELVPGVVGAVVGAYAWKKHRWLGMAAGFGIGSNIHGLMRGDGVHALCNMAVVGASIGGSLWLRTAKHPKLTAVGGFIVGNLAGSLVTSLVPGKD